MHMHVIVGVLLAWPNDQQCPDLSDFCQLWPDLWPKVARPDLWLKKIVCIAMPDFTSMHWIYLEPYILTPGMLFNVPKIFFERVFVSKLLLNTF